MKYKIITTGIFLMLMVGSVFGSASGIEFLKTNDAVCEDIALLNSDDVVDMDENKVDISEFGEPTIYITDPELGYIYIQFDCDEEPMKLPEYRPFLADLNLAVYITFCNQLHVDTFDIDIPDGSKAKFTMKNFLETEEYETWDNDSSDGFDVFFNIPCDVTKINIKVFKEITVKVYDPDGDLIASNVLPNKVLWIYIPPSQ